MKIRTIMTTTTTDVLLTAAGSSLTWGADRTCSRGYAGCMDYKYYRSHEHENYEGRWSEDEDWICPDGDHRQMSSPGTSGYGCHGGNSPHGRRGYGSRYK